METFKIKLSSKTEGHEETLKKMGFEVTKGDKVLLVKANPLSLQGEIDITDREKIVAFAKHCRDKKELATYNTKFRVKKGDGSEATVSSILACTFLGTTFSALIAKPVKAGAAGDKNALNLNDLDE